MTSKEWTQQDIKQKILKETIDRLYIDEFMTERDLKIVIVETRNRLLRLQRGNILKGDVTNEI